MLSSEPTRRDPPLRPHAAGNADRQRPRSRRFKSSGSTSNASPLLVTLLSNMAHTPSSGSSSCRDTKTMPSTSLPSAASSWTKATLDALNASFNRHMITEFVFDRTRLAIPIDWQQEIDSLADAISRVNNSDRLTPEFKFAAPAGHPLVHFKRFYEQLGLNLSRKSSPKQRPQEAPVDTTPPTQITLPFPMAPFTTPPSSDNPIDPQYSSGSAATASSGAESKDEFYTDSCANAFVAGSLYSLDTWLQQVAWYRETRCQLHHTDKQKMHINLLGNKITAMSDGGLSLHPDPYRSCKYPIFSIEVSQLNPMSPSEILIYQSKRKKHARIKDEDTYQMHAAQIYAEMLGQVCHRQLYQDRRMSQEAFVLHARHATFYLYYARFSNAYLQDIARYGSEYQQRASDPEQITIHQSRPYRMRFPQEQAKFFRLLADVLYYLVSGNSYVFYLAKDESNPLFKEVVGLNKPRVNECVQVMQSRGNDSVLEAEGPLDEEPDFPKLQTIHRRTDSDSNSAFWSDRAVAGSPMDSDDH